jgi:signal transduction histidine kinase
LLEAQAGSDAADGQRADCVGAIRQAGEQLLAIIDDILDMARIDDGGVALVDGTLDLSALVERATAALRFHATRQRVMVAVAVAADGDLPPVRGDERRLGQALRNLLSNAIKFSHPDATVSLTAGLAADGWVELSVRDQGIGMRPEDIEKALTPFAQIDQGANRRHEGIGLGLPLALRLAEAHDGTLRLDSAPGQGCAATIRLPPSRIMTIAELLARMS